MLLPQDRVGKRNEPATQSEWKVFFTDFNIPEGKNQTASI